MNDATRHHGSYNEAWDTIKALEDKVIETSNAKMGKMQWTVVASESIVQDNFFWVTHDRVLNISPLDFNLKKYEILTTDIHYFIASQYVDNIGLFV